MDRNRSLCKTNVFSDPIGPGQRVDHMKQPGKTSLSWEEFCCGFGIWNPQSDSTKNSIIFLDVLQRYCFHVRDDLGRCFLDCELYSVDYMTIWRVNAWCGHVFGAHITRTLMSIFELYDIYVLHALPQFTAHCPQPALHVRLLSNPRVTVPPPWHIENPRVVVVDVEIGGITRVTRVDNWDNQSLKFWWFCQHQIWSWRLYCWWKKSCTA